MKSGDLKGKAENMTQNSSQNYKEMEIWKRG